MSESTEIEAVVDRQIYQREMGQKMFEGRYSRGHAYHCRGRGGQAIVALSRRPDDKGSESALDIAGKQGIALGEGWGDEGAA